jgi:hypothetical protein
MVLLARFKPKENECVLSYLIRLSETNGFRHVGYLLKFAGLGWKNNRVPVHSILAGEYDLSRHFSRFGIESVPMVACGVYQQFKRVIDTPYVFVKHPKICPVCVESTGCCDHKWSFLPVIACSKHRSLLVDEYEKNDERLSWYRERVDGFNKQFGSLKPFPLSANSPVLKFNAFMESLITNSKADSEVPSIMEGLSFREVLTCINFLGHYSARLSGGAFRPYHLKNSDLADHFIDVWKVLNDWPDSLYKLLSQFIDHPMSQRGIAGLNKHYRDLHEQLYRRQENRGIMLIKEEFDRYISTRWPGVLEVNRLKRIKLPVDVSNIISKKDAALIIGCRPERIDRLVTLNQMSRIMFKGKAHYLRDEVERVVNLRCSNWTMGEACSTLKISRYQLKQLLDAKLLVAVSEPGPLNRDWLINRQQGEEFITRLINNSRLQSAPDTSISMAGVEHQGFSIVDILLLMLDGSLSYSCAPDKLNPFSVKQFNNFFFV